MIWRFRLNNATLGELTISEPDGWEDGKLRMERDKQFHSLSKYFAGSFIFYGDTGSANGGYDYLLSADALGIDEIVQFLADYSLDAVSYTNVFDGQVDLESLVQMPNGRIRATVIRNDLWAKFISRINTPVNLLSASDLDGNPRSIYTPCSLIGRSQVVQYKGQYEREFSTTFPSGIGFGLQLNWDKTIIDDLNKSSISEVKVDIGSDPGFTDYDNSSVVGLFQAPWDGEYTFSIGAESAVLFTNWVANSVEIFIRKYTDTSPLVNGSGIPRTFVSYGPDAVVKHEGSKTLTLYKGEEVIIIGFAASGSDRWTFFGTKRRKWKTDVAVATTSAIVLSGEQTIDGTLTSSSRVLVKDQGNLNENGIYVTASGAWSRASDSDTVFELIDAAVYVTGGTNNSATYWQQTNESLESFSSDPVFWTLIDLDDEKVRPYPGPGTPMSYLNVTANTSYPTTYPTGFLIHDAAAAICDRIIGKNDSFYSQLMGSFYTSVSYPSNGCYWPYFITRGLQLRGFDIDIKPISMSFMEWWNGLDPILNLGLGTKIIDGDEKIFVDKKENFYDDSTTSVDFYNLQFEREYDEDRNFNKITIGFEQWKSESVSGIDDPQTNHVYASRFKRTGKEIVIQSKFVASSAAIEFTRRQTLEKTSDYKFDNDTFIIALNPIPSEGLYPIPATYIPFFPEFNERFTSVTGISSPEAKYNLRLTPARNLLRWLPYINAGLQAYVGSTYKFQSGEGNFDMVSEMSEFDCDPAFFDSLPLSEKQDIPVTDICITVSTRARDIRIPMSIDEFIAIDSSPQKAIGISQTDSNPVKLLIDVLDYNFAKGYAVVTGWFKELYSLNLATGSISQPVCFGRFDAPCGDDSILSEDNDYLVSEDGECLELE
jgi:hypothetical protein